ncbi:MAG: phosphate acyltransferase PlsX [Magnetococcus sp. WYHC-3]
MTLRIALDAMGGDRAPGVVVEAALGMLERHRDLVIVLVGQPAAVEPLLQGRRYDATRLQLHPASEVVEMTDKPAEALRRKKDSSLRVGANLVKTGAVSALVSAGNTGALMAISKYVLKTLPGIDRPAIATRLPTLKGHTLMLDLGANVDCTPRHLVQFALMGGVYMSQVHGLTAPRIGLLNIGEEDMKGNDLVRDAGELLRQAEPNYIGNVEGDDIFKGVADVVVCDGFVGNVSLKTAEGVAKMLSQFLRDAFKEYFFAKLGYLVARPALRRFRDRVDPRRYNGAMLLGLNGIVVKSHGGADRLALENAIMVAMDLVRNRVNERIGERVTAL